MGYKKIYNLLIDVTEDHGYIELSKELRSKIKKELDKVQAKMNSMGAC